MGQTKKPTTTTKKPSTTVKSTSPRTTTKTTTTTTSPVVTTTPVEQQTQTTTPPPSTQKTNTSTSTTPSTTTTTTTTTQSSGPSKGKKTADPKPEKVKEPKPEKVKEPKPEKVREPKPERVKTPRASSGGGGVRFGIRAEASQIFSFESGGVQPDISPGVNAGLIVNIPFSETVSIQPEVLYSMQTIKVSAGNDFAKGTTNSILAPIMFNFNLGQGSTKFMINAGGYVDYLLSASSEQSISGVTKSGSIDLTGADKLGYGVAFGLGVKINGGFLIEARSFYDLKTSNNKAILSTIGIGYMF
jgi:Outer membrane protein beta-barrel domain